MINSKSLVMNFGLLIAVYVAALVGSGLLTVVTLGFAGSFAKILGTIAIWGVMAAMLISSAGDPEKTGVFFAPIVFCGLWISTACFTRIIPYFFQKTSITSAIAQKASKQENLVIFGRQHRGGIEKLLITGHIKSLTRFKRKETKSPVGEIITIGSNVQCDTVAISDKEPFKKLGHQDKCFVRTQLNALPDGLIIREKSRKSGSNCCDEVTLVVRKNGVEQELVRLQRGATPTLNLFPSVGRIIHRPYYGTKSIDLPDILLSVYSFDIRKPIKTP